MPTAATSLELPDVAGLTIRNYQGESDLPAMIAVIAAAKRADGIERTDTLETAQHNYRNLVNCDPSTDVLMVEVEGRLIGYSRVWWNQEVGLRSYNGICFVHPDWRNRGIGSFMYDWNRERIDAIAATHPPGPKVFRTWIDQGEKEAKSMLEGKGLEAKTYGASMSRSLLGELPDHPLPDGLEIRPATKEQMRTIWEADEEAFKDHWAEPEKTESDYHRYLEFPHTDLSLWRIAWDGDEVASQVRSFIDPEENEEYGRLRGYTEFISTRRPWRGKGVAKALIASSLQALKDRGMTEAALGVHVENPNGAFKLYESLGFTVDQMSTVYEGPMEA
jgi:GNAT superfamily N-acetyltransferase